MKLQRCFFPAALLLLLSSAVTAPSGVAARTSQPASREIRLRAAAFDVADAAGGWQEIRMDGFSTIFDPGKPMLPLTVSEFELPSGTIPASIALEVVEEKATVLPGTYRIAPAPKPLGGGEPSGAPGDNEATPGSDADQRVYGQDAYYPEAFVSLAPAVSRARPGGSAAVIARVVYQPLKYNPRTGSVLLAGQVRARLRYRMAAAIAATGQAAAADAPRAANYVIVTTNAIRDNSVELAAFVAHKTWRGFSVRVVTEDDYDGLTGPYPNGRAERIRQWLIGNYRQLGIEYVLLIGNPEPDDPLYSEDLVGDIPMKQVWHNLAGGNYWWGNATDAYYADLTGNWDTDGDGFYGESPWLTQARVPASSLPAEINRKAFSVRWSGSVTLATSKTVEIALNQWQGARLYLDGALFMDQWPQTRRKSDQRKSVYLAAGKHSLMVEYFQNTGHGHLKLIVDGVVPTGFSGYYFPTPDFSGWAAAVVGQTMDFNWETSDHASLDADGRGVDLEGEVRVGRIPVYGSNYSALDAVLRRTIDYETVSPPPWRQRVVLPMERMDAGTPSYDVGEAIKSVLPPDFAAYRIYEETFGLNPPPEVVGPASAASVVNALNQGAGIVAWMTHGTFRWANDLLDVKYQLPLVNTPDAPIFFQGSCHTGNIYLPDCYPGCAPDLNYLGEGDGRISLATSLLAKLAVGTVAATEVSTYQGGAFSPDPARLRRYNADLAYEFTRQLTVRNETTGEALRRIRYTPFGIAGVDAYNTYHNQLIYNLYGDPSIRPLAQPYPNRPPELAPIGAKEVPAGLRVSFTVGATDPDGDPLSFSVDRLAAGVSLSATSGSFSWATAPQQAGTHYLTFAVTDHGLPPRTDYEVVRFDVLPTRFTCDFTHGRRAGDPDWSVRNGRWSVTADKRYAARPRGANVALVRTARLSGVGTGEIRANLYLPRPTSARPKPNVSLLFGYVSASRFRSVILTPADISVAENGRVLSTKSLSIPATQWLQLTVRMQDGGAVDVLLDGIPLLSWQFPAVQYGRVGVAAFRSASIVDDFAVLP